MCSLIECVLSYRMCSLIGGLGQPFPGEPAASARPAARTIAPGYQVERERERERALLGTISITGLSRAQVECVLL